MLALFVACGAQARLYLVAGTPAYPGQLYYPTRLYEVQPDGGLKMTRELLGPLARLIDVRDDLRGDLFVWGRSASDEADPGEVLVVHERNPEQRDVMPITFSLPPGWLWGTAAGDQQPPAAVFGGVSPHVNGLHQGVIEVHADSHASPRIVAVDWSIYRSFLYTGGISAGEGTPVVPSACFSDGRTCLQCSPPGELKRFPQLGDLGPAPPGSSGGRGTLLADTPEYFVVWPSFPPAPPVDGGDTYDFSTKQLSGVEALNKRTGKWTSYDLPARVHGYSRVPVRMFGDWLTTLETEPAKDSAPGAG